MAARHVDLILLFSVTMMVSGAGAGGTNRCDGMWNVDVGPKPLSQHKIVV